MGSARTCWSKSRGRDTRDYSAIVAEYENGIRLDYTFSCFAPAAPSGCVIEYALEPAKLAYGAEISIMQHRVVTAKDFA